MFLEFGVPCCLISIHAPLAGSDARDLPDNLRKLQFQSTLPLRGATLIFGGDQALLHISIHAPLAGSDWKRQQG